MAEQRQENKRQKRKVITGIVYRWQTNRPIPYEFRGNNGLTATELIIIIYRMKFSRKKK